MGNTDVIPSVKFILSCRHFGCPLTSELCPSFRPQNIELGATGGASKQDSSNMAEMTVEEMTMRANQVTDEVH